MVDIEVIDIVKDSETQVILGHAGFIKTAEDLYEAIVNSTPNVKFGIAFAEASGPCLVRSEGNDLSLKKQSEENMLKIGTGHAFVIMMKNAYPINVTNAIKGVPEVARIFCATANPVQVLVAKTNQGRGIVGVVDGSASKGLEADDDKAKRKKLLRDIGYKL